MCWEWVPVVNRSITKHTFSDIQSEPSFEQFIIMSCQAVIINFKNKSLLISHLPYIILTCSGDVSLAFQLHATFNDSNMQLRVQLTECNPNLANIQETVIVFGFNSVIGLPNAACFMVALRSRCGRYNPPYWIGQAIIFYSVCLSFFLLSSFFLA